MQRGRTRLRYPRGRKARVSTQGGEKKEEQEDGL